MIVLGDWYWAICFSCTIAFVVKCVFCISVLVFYRVFYRTFSQLRSVRRVFTIKIWLDWIGLDWIDYSLSSRNEYPLMKITYRDHEVEPLRPAFFVTFSTRTRSQNKAKYLTLTPRLNNIRLYRWKVSLQYILCNGISFIRIRVTCVRIAIEIVQK